MSNLRYAVNEIRLYQYGFDKYNISSETNIEEGELLKVAWGLIGYFNSSEESIAVQISDEGGERDLFNQREVAHLRDVKSLIQLCYRLQEITLIYAIGYVGLSWVRRKGAWLRSLGKGLLGGSVVTIALLVTLGAGVALNFEELFLRFHWLSFQNDLWLLDPSRDYLIRLFPQGFFFDVTLLIAGATIAEALIIAGIAGGYLIATRKKAAPSISFAGYQTE